MRPVLGRGPFLWWVKRGRKETKPLRSAPGPRYRRRARQAAGARARSDHGRGPHLAYADLRVAL